MDKSEIKGGWNELKGKTKQVYSDLTYTHLRYGDFVSNSIDSVTLFLCCHANFVL